MPQPTRAELARSFDAAAEVYERARPTYPQGALDWLLPDGARRVLDLGAGTGKLTGLLADRGFEVTAVEPSDGMRARLDAALGDRVVSRAGTAESIPLPDDAVDVVLVAQAWHWVDPARAVPEVARVLAPGGRLGLLWNRRDERVPWVAAFSRILGGPESTPQPDARPPDARELQIGPPFGPVRRDTTEVWSERLTPDGLVELAASRSYVITLDEPARLALLERVHTLTSEHPDLAGRPELTLPYVTDCVSADLTSASP